MTTMVRVMTCPMERERSTASVAVAMTAEPAAAVLSKSVLVVEVDLYRSGAVLFLLGVVPFPLVVVPFPLGAVPFPLGAVPSL